MNTLQKRCKICNCTLPVCSIAAMFSAVWNDRGRPLPAVRSIELVVRNFRIKPSNFWLYNFCKGIS